MFRHPDKANQDKLVSGMTPLEKLMHDIDGLAEDLEPVQTALMKMKKKVVLLSYFETRDKLRKDQKNAVETHLRELPAAPTARQNAIHAQMLELERRNLELIEAMQQQAKHYAGDEKIPLNFSEWSPQLANRVRIGLDQEYQHYLIQKNHANHSKKIIEAQTTFSTLRTTVADLTVQLQEKTASLDSLLQDGKREHKHSGPTQ